MSSTDLEPGYERVYTVVDYYDGPRKGVADYQGKPHLYECINYSDAFLLAPLDTEDFWFAMEDWAIYQRWELAYQRGKTDLSTHPALPDESERHKELEGILEKVLVIDPAKALTRIGHFEAMGGEPLPKGVLRPLQVKWAAKTRY